ncbi:MAG: hypothetical protein JRN58_00225 [Nitrososphaerota archaeon]|nr:hypothetical protein [Nitrososphaerota archaeon]
MRGLWRWPSEQSDQERTLRQIAEEDELGTIMLALSTDSSGLSNAQIDRLLKNNSQWRTLRHMKELIALGFVNYKVQYFGEAGRYELTDLGRSALSNIQKGGQ